MSVTECVAQAHGEGVKVLVDGSSADLSGGVSAAVVENPVVPEGKDAGNVCR